MIFSLLKPLPSAVRDFNLSNDVDLPSKGDDIIFVSIALHCGLQNQRTDPEVFTPCLAFFNVCRRDDVVIETVSSCRDVFTGKI